MIGQKNKDNVINQQKKVIEKLENCIIELNIEKDFINKYEKSFSSMFINPKYGFKVILLIIEEGILLLNNSSICLGVGVTMSKFVRDAIAYANCT